MAAVRFGIIACSSVARRRFVPALCASAKAKLQRIGSRDHAKADQLARTFNCSQSGSYEAVLEDKNVDAVYISTPVTFHEEWILKAAAHKKHIVCEKPAFMNYSAAKNAVELCRKNGVRLFEGYTFRHHPQHALVKNLIQEGRIGEPRLFEAQFTYPRPSEGDIRLNPDVGGGVFFDSGGYPVAAALLSLTKTPISVCSCIHRDQRMNVDNSVSIMMRFPDGQTAQVTAGFDFYYRAKYSILGTKGRIEVDRAFSVLPDKTSKVSLETETGIETFSVNPADQFQIMLEDFCDEITAGLINKNYEEELLRQHKVLDAAWRSNLEQRIVQLTEYSE